MSDHLAGGIDVIGTFTPIQLWAGEPNGQSTQGVAAAGYKFGQKNSRGETYLFAVVALVGGLLVPWNPLADSDVPNAFATGTFTFATAVPTAGETIAIGGDTITFRAAANPALAEVTIGASLADTATNLANYINAHRDTFGPVPVTAVANSAVVTVKAPGIAGNAITLAETTTNVAVSGANLSGGTDSDAEVGGAREPYGILPHALDTTVTGYNATVETPVFISGHPAFDALDLPVGTTYAEIKAAFAGTMINVQKLL